MPSKQPATYRNHLLRELRRRRFDRYRFVGTDALVMRAPKEGSLPARIRVLKQTSDYRLYPKGRGCLIKWKYYKGPISDGCWLEAGTTTTATHAIG